MITREQIEQKLEGYRLELLKGREELTALEERRAYLHPVIMRLAGACEAMEELLKDDMDG